jgi:excisionase family DNA binding protein
MNSANPEKERGTAAMNEGTRAAIEALLKADGSITPAHRRAILDACDMRAPAPETPDRLLTMKEAAARSGRSTRTLFRWIKDGRLEPVRLSARLFQLREADLLRLADAEDGHPAPARPARNSRLAAALTHARKKARSA